MCVFVHLCLCSSKIKTQAYSLIRPLSSSRVWRQNGVGTMTPRQWRLTPSPTLLTAPQNWPSPTHTPASLTQTPSLYKRTCQDGNPPPLLPAHAHTDTETSPPPYTAVIAPGGTLLRIADPQKTALFLPLCVSFSLLPTLFFTGQITQCGDSHRAGHSYCRQPLLAHVWLARSVGLIASEVNKIGDKNQFQKRPGTQEAALR